MKKILLLLLLVQVVIVYSQKKDMDPSWVYLKRAENHKDMGDYSLAVIEARKARAAYINEKIEKFYLETRESNKDKTDYEVKKIVESKEKELLAEDTFPQYHELMGDLYCATGFLTESEKEYKEALSGEKYFEYKQKGLEIKYKLADVYEKKYDYDLADIINRDITAEFFKSKDKEYWNRIKDNIKKDPSLGHVFRIYRLDGIEYMKAIYNIGKRSAMLQRNNDALFYLSVATIIWMTYYSNLIKANIFDFNYATPTDFIALLEDLKQYEYIAGESIIEEILFFIGYVYHLNNDYKIRNHYFELANAFSAGSTKQNKISILTAYLSKKTNHILTYEEIF